MAIRIIAACQVVSSPEPRSIAARIWSACGVLGSSMRSAATNSSRLVLVPRTSSNDAKYASASATDNLTASGFPVSTKEIIHWMQSSRATMRDGREDPSVSQGTDRAQFTSGVRSGAWSPSVAGSVQRAARAHHEDSPSGQPRRTLRGWCGLSREAEARAATSGHLDQHLRPPRPEANVPRPRGTGSAPSAPPRWGRSSPFSVEGFPSRAAVEGEHGETGLSLHRTMLSRADGGP